MKKLMATTKKLMVAKNQQKKTVGAVRMKEVKMSKAKLAAQKAAQAREDAGDALIQIASLQIEPECVTDTWGWCSDLRDCLSDDAAKEFGEAVSKKCRGDLCLFNELYKDESKRPVLNSLVVLQDAYSNWHKCDKCAREAALRLLPVFAEHPNSFRSDKPFDMNAMDPCWDWSIIGGLPEALLNRVGNAVLGDPPAKMSAAERELVNAVKGTCQANEYYDMVLWQVATRAVYNYTADHPECRGIG